MSVDAALLCAVDPLGLGGVALRAPPGPARDAWLASFRTLMGDAPWARIPPDLPDNRLLGGLDLAATLALGRPVAEAGVLARVDGGTLLVAMAERMGPATAARIGGVMDAGEATVAREGVALAAPTRFTTILLDEGIEADEAAPAALLERLAFHVELSTETVMVGLDPTISRRKAPILIEMAGSEAGHDEEFLSGHAKVLTARAALPSITTPDVILEALVTTAATLGIDSPRAVLLALAAARAAAALESAPAVTEDHAALATRLVLGPRATLAPPPAEAPPPPPPTEDDPAPMPDAQQLQELLLAAAAATLPADLLDRAQIQALAARTGGGRAGAARAPAQRGRPIGARAGQPGRGARLAVLDTLRAAAPWQTLRARPPHARIALRREDFRIRRFRRRNETTAIFAVDASGSAALHRLAEAKGAVELLLAEAYVRRDRVALIGFRGAAADLLLPPTHALARAKRSLAGLPGGGTTPLASGIDAAAALAIAEKRAGRAALVILLTDGRGNVARDGGQGHARATTDALDAARGLRAQGTAAILLDTAPRPQPAARALAEAAGAIYLPMPMADAARMSKAAAAAATHLRAPGR